MDRDGLLNLNVLRRIALVHEQQDLTSAAVISQCLPWAMSKLRLPRAVAMTQRLHGACGVPRVLEKVGVCREGPSSWVYFLPFPSAVFGRPAL